MNTQLSVSLFSVQSPQGEQLRQAISQILQKEFGISVRCHLGATGVDYLQSCADDDIVILDASMDQETEHNFDIAQPLMLKHVLVVSRTYLPLNFYSFYDDGFPDYPFPKSQSNDEILDWLIATVASLRPFLPRPQQEKGIARLAMQLRQSSEMQENIWNKQGQVFISYRSRYYDEVKQLSEQIAAGQFHDGTSRTVYFLPPGALVYEDEVLTAHRRWQLASSIDRRIYAADEVWVYETADYYGSWWTRAELVTLSYRGKNIPKIRIFHPDSQIVRNAPPGFLPEIDKAQRKRMARWYANCDPRQMGYESVEVMRMYATLPLIGRLKFFNDPVFSQEFWENPLITCSECRQRVFTAEQQRGKINVEDFLWLREPGLFAITSVELQKALQERMIKCPLCHSAYRVQEEVGAPRYVWIPITRQALVTPADVNLVKFPVYRVQGFY